MKFKIVQKITSFFITLFLIYSCSNQGDSRKKVLSTKLDSVSYALGAYIDMNFIKTDFKEINHDLFQQAIRESKDSTKSLLNEKDIIPVLIDFSKKKAEERDKGTKKKGEEFLEANKSKEGIVVTESGLQYSILNEGKGKKPTEKDIVKVHYHGTTPEGVVFDSSVDRGKPSEFPLNSVIKGWIEGLQLMKIGSKYKFFIPQELAYGENAPIGGNGPIKPYMLLIFEVELLEIIEK